MDLLRATVRPREIITRAASRTRSPRSPRPAARPTPCCTCWRSRARPASPLDHRRLRPDQRATPLLADLKPGGRFVATDLHRAGGTALVASGCSRRACCTPRITVTGRTIGEEAAQARRDAGQARSCARSPKPLKPTGGLVILQAATSRPRAAS
jgi:dihydroxy-acid dehydratase